MRTNNSIKNIITALIGQGLGIILSFILRMVFISILGAEYLGVNGLFTNILSILSLAEMGLGSAIIYSLYKPLAVGDVRKIKELMHFYELAYRGIGVIIFILGIGMIPFLEYIIKDQPNIPHLTFIYLLFLINTVASYFFAYKRSLIIADQKSYITTIYRYGFYAVLNILQIGILLITKNFILFLLAQIIITIIENLMVSFKANRLYTFLKDEEKVRLDKISRQEISKNVKALMCHRIGNVVVNGTDNIIISIFVGVFWVGLYSNYYLITNSLNIIIGQIFTSVTASIGNLSVVEGREKNYFMYKSIFFINFWIAGLSSVMLWILINPFITTWVGKEYILTKSIVFIIIINFYIMVMRKTTLVYRDAMGLFWHDRYKPIFEAVINIVVSVLLAPKLGIAGVFIGTFISTVTTAFWVEPYILYKYGFEMKVRDYFFRYIKFTLVILVAGIVTHQICNVFTTVTWMSLFGRAAVCVIVPNFIFLGCFYRTDEFKYFWNLFKGIFGKVLKLKSKSAEVN